MRSCGVGLQHIRSNVKVYYLSSMPSAARCCAEIRSLLLALAVLAALVAATRSACMCESIQLLSIGFQAYVLQVVRLLLSSESARDWCVPAAYGAVTPQVLRIEKIGSTGQ
eukprot:13047-Heterococcus_DN1.PRE.1